MDLFEVKLKFQKALDDGNVEKRNDTYIVEAYNFTDAEAVVFELISKMGYMTPMIKGMKPIEYTDIFGNNEFEKWYKASIKVLVEVKDNGKEKYQKQYMLVNADTLDDALRNLKNELKNISIDWESVGIQETSIVEVIRK